MTVPQDQTPSKKPPQWDNSMKIVERIVICGKLKLDTPARFGGGQDDAMLDMPLLRDDRNGWALLTGASIAGALRDYARQCELGYEVTEGKLDTVTKLFGFRDDKDGEHSLLIVRDALGDDTPVTELRDGVAIDPRTRTAEDEKKFDLELLAAGSTFDVRFELRVIEDENRDALVNALATALTGLQNGEIGLGARKRRGLGRCHIEGGWRVACYDMRKPQDLIGWLNNDPAGNNLGDDLFLLLGVAHSPANDQRERFLMEATFGLEGSLLIRSGSGDVQAADVVHLLSGTTPVLSGTSLAGALRARALRIISTLRPKQSDQNWQMIDAMFGVRAKKRDDELSSSHLVVHESEIKQGVADLVQNRVAIDRFTGGSYPAALFNEQPVFGKPETEVTVKLEMRRPQDHEIGLLLLLLKDLWTSDLPLGGESSVGRGRLQGKSARLVWQRPNQTLEWMLTEHEQTGLHVSGDKTVLEHFVSHCLSQTLNDTEVQHAN